MNERRKFKIGDRVIRTANWENLIYATFSKPNTGDIGTIIEYNDFMLEFGYDVKFDKMSSSRENGTFGCSEGNLELYEEQPMSYEE